MAHLLMSHKSAVYEEDANISASEPSGKTGHCLLLGNAVVSCYEGFVN